MISFTFPALVITLLTAVFLGYAIGGHWFGWDDEHDHKG